MTNAPPLGVYVHWPYCARICPYCDFNVVMARGREDEERALARAIAADLSAHARRLGPRTLSSIFFGGGTPSLMKPEWVAAIVARARELWPAEEDLEVSLEANPTDAEAARFRDLAAAGVNRLSLGVQALDDAALAFLGRNHGAAEAVRAADIARTAFPRLSLDLIYARPDQTPQAWAEELRRAVDLGPEHLSPYQLTIEPGTAFDRAVRRKRWAPPEGDLAADLYDTTQAVLEDAGFEAYEVSNHARGEAARSRHNLIYWTGGDYVGAGPGGHGRLTVEGGRLATEAVARIPDYIAAVEAAGIGWEETERLSPEASAEERLLMGLRTVIGVPFADIAALGLSPSHPAVAEQAAAGRLVAEDGRLRATPAGRLVLDRLTAELANSPSP